MSGKLVFTLTMWQALQGWGPVSEDRVDKIWNLSGPLWGEGWQRRKHCCGRLANCQWLFETLLPYKQVYTGGNGSFFYLVGCRVTWKISMWTKRVPFCFCLHWERNRRTQGVWLSRRFPKAVSIHHRVKRTRKTGEIYSCILFLGKIHLSLLHMQWVKSGWNIK